MCVPALAAPLALAGAVVGAAGSVMQGAQAKAQGDYEANVATQNARLPSEQSQYALQQGQRDLQLQYRREGQLKGQQAASMAANGVDLGFGSALDVQRDTAMLGSEDARTIGMNTFQQMRGYDIQTANFRGQAAAAKMRGDAAFTNGIFGAATTLLGGASQYGQIQSRMGGAAIKKATNYNAPYWVGGTFGA